MIKIFNNPFFNAVKNISRILDPDQKKRSIIMVGLMFVNAVFDVAGLAAIFPLIDAALNPELIQEKWYLHIPYEWIGAQDHITFLFILSLFVFGVFLVKNLISIAIFYIQSRYAFNIAQRLMLKTYQNYYDQGYLHISNTESGKKNYDVLTIPYYFAVSYLLETLLLATEILVLGIIFGLILFSNPAAMLILIIVILPVFIGVYLITKNKTKTLGNQRNILHPKTTSILLDSFNAYIDIKLGNKEKYFYNVFAENIRKINDIDALQNGIFSKIHQRLNDVVLGLALALIFGFAYFFRENSSQVIAILSVFGLAAYRFLPSVNRIMGSTLALKNMSYIIEELKKVSNFRLKEYKNIQALPIHQEIAFHNISYTYPLSEISVLKELSLSIKVGETIGIIGSSGSGKTTFLNLFLRLVHETEGSVTIDHKPLDDTTNASFQKAIGYVQQAVYIKNGTLIENIAFGEDTKEIDYDKLDKAIKNAMLENFVDDHPKGKMMPLGENGVMLSGGQRQRIGIARALYKNAQILLFDEATSALDPKTEKAIVQTIYNLTNLGKTIIIVAHRVTTLEMCDRIYELKDGTVSGVFSYEEVMNKFDMSAK